MAADAPRLHENMIAAGVEPAPDKPSNVAKVVEFVLGDVDAGFAQAEVIVEAFKKTGVIAKLTVKTGAGHGWRGTEKDLETFADWFDKNLVKPTTPRNP